MQKSVEITGVVKEIFSEIAVSEKLTLKKFALTINAEGPFPQHVLFQLANNKILLLDDCKEGDTVKAVFNVQGKCHKKAGEPNKYYNSLEVFKLERL